MMIPLSRISRGHIFLIIRSYSYLPRCPAPYRRGAAGQAQTDVASCGARAGQTSKKPWYTPLSLPRFCGAGGARGGAKPKILPHRGVRGVGQKTACPVVCPAPETGGKTWMF